MQMERSEGYPAELSVLATQAGCRSERHRATADLERQACDRSRGASAVLRFRERVCTRHEDRCVLPIPAFAGDGPVGQHPGTDRPVEERSEAQFGSGGGQRSREAKYGAQLAAEWL